MNLTSGYPLWPVADGLIRTYPALETSIACDVVIIGGGITGALVAHHLVDAGFDTVVVDKREIGWGSTAGSTALLQYEIDITLTDLSAKIGADRAARAYLACRDAIHSLQRLAKRVPKAAGFERKKSLYLATRRSDRETLRVEHARRRAIGLDVDWLDESDIAKRFAFRRPAALLTREAAQVDAYAFTHGLLHDASCHGLRVFDRTPVSAIEPTRRGVVVETADGHVVRAGRLVFASGYETHEVLRRKVARLASTYALASEPLARLDGWGEGQCLIWEHASPYSYMRTTADGRVIVGGEDDAFSTATRRDRSLPRKTERLAARFCELFPDIPVRVAFAWAGTFGETDDGLAYIGKNREWPNAYFALGYGGNGITFGVIAAEIIRDALLGRRNDNAELFAFDR